jgi:hypothetical protein
MPIDSKLTMDECAKKFSWWWRGLFEPGASHAIGATLSREMIFDRHTLVRPGVDLGKAFRGAYRQRERSAYLYELEKRIRGQYRYAKPWIELDEKHRKELETLWPGRTTMVICSHRQPGVPHPAGHTKPVWISWNLKTNNNTLIKQFREFILDQRKQLDIPNPRANAGRSNRPRSWRPIEYLDIMQHHVGRLDDSESSQVAKARDEYEKSLPKGI